MTIAFTSYPVLPAALTTAQEGVSGELPVGSVQQADDHDHAEDAGVEEVLPPYVKIPLHSVIALAIVVNNTLIIVAILTRRHLQTVPNMYVASLAAADLLLGLLMAANLASTPWSARLDHSPWGCSVSSALIYVLVSVSTLSMLVIALDRFLCIHLPLRYPALMTRGRAALLIGATWAAGLLYGSVPLYAHDYSRGLGCQPTHVFPEGYMVGTHPALFFTVCLLSLALYGVILKAVVRQRRLIQAQEDLVRAGSAELQLKQRRSNYRVARMLFLVFGLHALAWAPLVVVAVLEYTVHVSHVHLAWCGTLVAAHSAVNCLVYAALNTEFRASFRAMLCRFRRGCSGGGAAVPHRDRSSRHAERPSYDVTTRGGAGVKVGAVSSVQSTSVDGAGGGGGENSQGQGESGGGHVGLDGPGASKPS